ncbi:E3 ubiquitin-protein ligase TRIM65-like [Odontesthes bonariensis]
MEEMAKKRVKLDLENYSCSICLDVLKEPVTIPCGHSYCMNTELKRKDAELKQLSHTEDHSQFLLNYPSVSALRGSTHSPSIKIRYLFWYNNMETYISGPQSSRVGVYLDHRAGILSFYSVSGTMTLLHRVQTTFTQPLYPGVWIWGSGATAEFV